MSDNQEHLDPAHAHPHPAPQPTPAPEIPEDATSRALADALRSSFFILKVAMGVLLLIFCFSGWRQVGSQETAIRLQFGKPVGEGARALLGPGLHFAWPYPIDEVVKIPVTQIQTVSSSIGWFGINPDGTESYEGASLNPAVDSYTLTADGNIIHARATLRYRINDPIRYHFDFVNASSVVQNALDHALVYASSHHLVDDALTRDLLGFKEKVLARLNELIQKQKLGIVVEQCDVETRPPRQLKEAFKNVLQAELKRSQVLNNARTNETYILTKASADAAARINEARTERVRLVEFVAAEAKRFSDLLPQYRANPELFAHQRLTETLGRVLTNAHDKFLIPQRPDGKPVEIRLQLNREPAKAPPAGGP
jgi:membrane protease subunit HflK